MCVWVYVWAAHVTGAYALCLACTSNPRAYFIRLHSPQQLSAPPPTHTPTRQVLLCALVNKLGDPSRKLASDAAFLLGQLLLQHPVMKMVVVREVSWWLVLGGLWFVVGALSGRLVV